MWADIDLAGVGMKYADCHNACWPGAVLSEREYKQGDGQSDFWVAAWRHETQALGCLCSLLVFLSIMECCAGGIGTD